MPLRECTFAAVCLLFACHRSVAPASPSVDAAAVGVNPQMAPPSFIADLAHSKYPIVLIHGFGGIATLGTSQYFFGVSDALTKDGLIVFQPQLSPWNSSEVRAAELVTALEKILVDTGADKLILIAHSQGGLDARLAALSLSSRIDAIFSISTPHHGTAVANLGTLGGPNSKALLAAFGVATDPNGTIPIDAIAAFTSLSPNGAADFNQRVPDQPGIAYFSLAGRSNAELGTTACASSAEPAFIAKWDGVVDPTAPALIASAAILNLSERPSPPNDGLIRVDSAYWGTFLGCIPADHFDEVCTLGLPAGVGNPFDCISFYRELAQFAQSR